MWITYTFHTKGQHSINSASPEKLKNSIQILMAPSSRQLLNTRISSYLLYNLSTSNLYNLLNPTNSTSLDIAQHESPTIQTQKQNAGLHTKMSRINAVIVGAQEKSNYLQLERLNRLFHFISFLSKELVFLLIQQIN